VASPSGRHPLAGGDRPLSWTTVVLVIVQRWSSDQVTEVLGALVPVVALLRGSRAGLAHRA
jgi:ethanolamine ammonia-lyase small subunit